MLDHLSTRRVFLQRGMALLAVTPTIPTFLDSTVMALAKTGDTPRTQLPSGKDGKILVVVQLSGGNDGLNTVVPYADDAYHRARPLLAVKKTEVVKVNDQIGLHPNLAPLMKLYEAGQMSIIQGIGYPNPNRSHFRSMDIWQSADPANEQPTSGWIGRYFDNACPGADPHVGVSIGESMPLAMQGAKVRPLSFERADSYKYIGKDRARYEAMIKTDASPKPVSELDYLCRTAMDAQVSSDNVLRMTQSYRTGATYPGNEFGAGLRTIAAMIAGGLPTRVYYVSLTGFDTHAGQKQRHDQLMKDLAAGISAFWSDLKAQGNDDRVMMLSFSEFGRRVSQNASLGTDHGAAAPMFLFGKHLARGLAGKHPSLTDLDQGDLKFNTDFRSVYSAVLEKWMETPSEPILGKRFEPLGVVKA